MAVVSGGTTLIDNGALDAGVPTGSLTLLSTQTASASASIEFTSGIDSTYDVYVFKFYNIHLASDDSTFTFQASTDGGSSYGITTTNSRFNASHKEDNSSTSLSYAINQDLAQSTTFINLAHGIGSDNDQCFSGTLTIYNPSSTTFVKHYLATTSICHSSDRMDNTFLGGYFNTTTALNAFKFQGFTIAGGGGITTPNINIDDGIIKMYGVK
jgi:hypothetical protein